MDRGQMALEQSRKVLRSWRSSQNPGVPPWEGTGIVSVSPRLKMESRIFIAIALLLRIKSVHACAGLRTVPDRLEVLRGHGEPIWL